jgi:hypothetical protein
MTGKPTGCVPRPCVNRGGYSVRFFERNHLNYGLLKQLDEIGRLLVLADDAQLLKTSGRTIERDKGIAYNQLSKSLSRCSPFVNLQGHYVPKTWHTKILY